MEGKLWLWIRIGLTAVFIAILLGLFSGLLNWVSVLENLSSDFLVFFLVVFAGGWLWIYFTQRKKLLSFFQTDKTKRVVIYLSDLRVLRWGTTGSSGGKLSYEGDAVAYDEMLAAHRLQSLFSFIIPALAEASETIGRIFLSDTKAEIKVSQHGNIDKSAPIISLGTRAYNDVSEYIEKTGKGIVTFRFGAMSNLELQNNETFLGTTVYSSTDPNPQITPSGIFQPDILGYQGSSPSGSPSNDDIDIEMPQQVHQGPSEIIIEGETPIIDSTYAVVQRVMDTDNSRTLFLAAGLSVHATKGAAFYLANNWKVLYNKYGGEKPFLVGLQIDPHDYGLYSIKLEKEITK